MNSCTETYDGPMNTVDGKVFLDMMRQGRAKLYQNRATVNDLNVFPIPDGDTGDNMYMTISSACEAAAEGGVSLQQLASSFSRGALMGARGNSGVILSRIFSGISKGLSGLDSASVPQFVKALRTGVEESYSSVSNPVEGTILTVWRESVAKVEAAAPSDLRSCIMILVDEMKVSLERTPQLLDVLRDAGVVDSGGAGLLFVAEGMLDCLNGEREDAAGDVQSSAKMLDFNLFGKDDVMRFGYCTEFLLRLQSVKLGDTDSFDESVIRSYLDSVGESVVCFREGSIVKVHVHTMTPGDILNRCQQWGEFLTLKIENMTLQHNETHKSEEPVLRFEKEFGVVAVATGRGFINVFREAGADYVIEGGQTMNPSVRSFIDAFDSVKAKNIFVFPNNSNIVMTARQAASLYDKSNVIVIPSKNLGAGYIAAASIDFSCKDVSQIEEALLQTVSSVTSGYVSRAIRDSSLDGVNARTGDFVGISGGKIVTSGSDRNDALLQLASLLDTSSHDVVMVFKGADASDSELSDSITALQSSFLRTEFIPMDGGQPVYDYIIVLC